MLERGATVSQTCNNKRWYCWTINCQSNLDYRVLYKKKINHCKKRVNKENKAFKISLARLLRRLYILRYIVFSAKTMQQGILFLTWTESRNKFYVSTNGIIYDRRLYTTRILGEHLPPPFLIHKYGNRQMLPSPTQ